MYAEEARSWIRKAYNLGDRSVLPDDAVNKFLHPALRNDEPRAEAVAEFNELVERFIESEPDATAESLLVPCRWTSLHPQPCLCPFMWFAYRNRPQMAASAMLVELSSAAESAEPSMNGER